MYNTMDDTPFRVGIFVETLKIGGKRGGEGLDPKVTRVYEFHPQ